MGVDEVPTSWEDVEGWPQRGDLQDEAPFADPHGLREAPRERSTPSSGVRSQLEVEGEGGLSMRAGTGVENTTGEERGGRRDFGERPPSSSSPPSLSSSLRVETAPQAAPSRAAEVPAADEGPRSSTGSAGRTSTSSQMTASKSRARGRGFQDILCVGFAVALCLNFGSITARGEGFFAAGLTCVSETTSDRVLRDLGVWVGWRRAVPNTNPQDFFNLEDLSLMGSAMGILTVVGHATDVVVNAMGIALLLHARRKPAEERLSRAVKRICWTSLAMAAWLCGVTMAGFLIAVRGPIGSATVDIFDQRYNLTCEEAVSVSIDYAYAMTTLTVLCQFFIGLVAIPNPVRWCSSASRSRDPPASLCGANPDGAENFGRGTVVASTNGGERGISRLRSSGSRSSTGGRRRSGSAADENRRNRGNGSAAATAGSLALDPDMFRTTICEPV